jgi:preprotein translocase subunit SecD
VAPPPSAHLRAGRYFATLAGLLAILYALVFLTGSSTKPKLGLDLEGGTTVTLQARTTNGKPPNQADMDVARNIIEDRVNGLGVANSEVVVEGTDRIIISVPGKNGEQAKQLGSTAQLYFRPVIQGPLQASPPAKPSPSPTTSSSPGASGKPTPSATATKPKAKATSTKSTKPQGDVIPPIAQAPKPKPTPTVPPTAAPTAPTAQLPPGITQADLAKPCPQLAKTAAAASPSKAIVACSADGKQKYILAPSIISGTQVSNAQAQFGSGGNSLGGWTILIDLKSKGQGIWADYTSKHNKTATPNDPANLVAFVLDGKVLSAPEIQGTINGSTQVTGQFDQKSATTLSNDLKYGALPLSFSVSQAETISPTLGSDQLKAGLLAGGIGLILVVIYSLIYYRALGLVTIASLIVSGLLVYACIVLLGRQIGFTLTLAGIAGFIVAVGITADSFVVFFERLKEEVHEGRSMRSGVPRAWVRARRTILTADAVSFLAAAILYYLAAGDVKGFAFTLGLSTILDLVVVFLFTHPLISVASLSKTFSSPRFSGLGAVQAARAEEQAAAAEGPSAADRAAARRRDRVTKES